VLAIRVSKVSSLKCGGARGDVTGRASIRTAFAGGGVGWANLQMLVAAAAAGARIHTSDSSVRRVCTALGLALA
jgi:hypothetical protein